MTHTPIHRPPVLVGVALLMLAMPFAVLAGPQSDGRYTRNVAIVIWDGAEVLDWAGPSEVFESASRMGQAGDEAAFRVYTVAKTKAPVTSQRVIRVLPEYSIADAPQPDIIVLPGGGTNPVLNDPGFMTWIGSAATEAEVALSVCTGAFVLARTGLLDDHDVTTWYGATARMREQFPSVRVQEGRRFIDNGRIITTAGISAGLDGSLHVVARLLGRHVADRTARYMEYAWSPPSYLAREYSLLNPSLDERGRRRQQAEIHAAENRVAAAISDYRWLVEEDPADGLSWQQLADLYRSSGRYREGIEASLQAAKSDDLRVTALYHAAVCSSQLNDSDQALKYLNEAIRAGFDDRAKMMADPDLSGLRGDPRFIRLLQKR